MHLSYMHHISFCIEGTTEEKQKMEECSGEHLGLN